MNLDQYSCRVKLRNGDECLLRAIRPDDKNRLLDGFHRLKGKSIYFRFFSAKKDLTEKELKFFTEIDFEHHVALVLAIKKNQDEKIIGVGRYIELMHKGPVKVAEVAFAVDDEHQNLGVGTILFEHLITIATQKGITKIEADVLAGNRNMLEIFDHSGFKLNTTMNSGVIHIDFDVTTDEFKRYYLK